MSKVRQQYYSNVLHVNYPHLLDDRCIVADVGVVAVAAAVALATVVVRPV